jgi:hypothetical protein
MELCKAVFPFVATDEVIITQERIEHIKSRHPGVYERYHTYMRSIVESPAYILEDSKPNTIALLGVYAGETKQFMLIVRLHTAADPEGYINSVITFMRLSKKRYHEYIANKKILYKRE